MPALVILRIDRAALDVKWSLDGMRFAVTSGAKCAPVCTYEETNDWFVQTTLLC
jgi:actin related protein 2/3 complex subunit 1A/1B